jgi:hypothetical protein
MCFRFVAKEPADILTTKFVEREPRLVWVIENAVLQRRTLVRSGWYRLLAHTTESDENLVRVLIHSRIPQAL